MSGERSRHNRQVDRACEALKRAIRNCLNRGVPHVINLSLPRHTVTTPVLRDFVYDRRYAGRSIPIVFSDGSSPPPFPVGCLEDGEPPALPSDRTLHVGLMSFRHPELDYLVDLYVTRNTELADEPTMADEEQLSFDRTIELFRDPALDEGGEICAFHTGLEPMVVGFYRGIVRVLQDRRARGLPRTLVVRPCLYAGPRDDGPFDCDSPGAKIESYDRGSPWW